MVVYEITKNLVSVNSNPFYISLRAIQCADFMEEGHIYVRNREPVPLTTLIDNLDLSSDKSLIPRLLLDISTQIEMLWSINCTLLPFDEQDVYKIGSSFCVLAPEKISTLDMKTQTCSLTVPIKLGQYMAPEVCSCMRLPCQTFCGKYSALYSLGMLAANLIGEELDDDSHLGITIKNLTHDNPLRRIPVVF